MKNIEMEIKGDKLVITIDLKKDFGLSASGKSIVVATTAGNITVPGHDDIKLGINAYKAK